MDIIIAFKMQPLISQEDKTLTNKLRSPKHQPGSRTRRNKTAEHDRATPHDKILRNGTDVYALCYFTY